MSGLIEGDDQFENDVILYSILYTSVTLVFAMAVLSKFLTNEFRFGFRSVLSLAVLFLGEPLCQFMVKGPFGVCCFAFGCLLIYSILPASHLPVGNKAVLITGCDTGFGHALAKKLDKIGMRVYAGCLDRDGPGAVSLRNSCSDKMHLVQLDVTSDKEIMAAVQYVTQSVGEDGLWGLVNNAGVWYFSEIEMTSDSLLKKVFDINLFGAVKVTKSFLPLIRASKGRIVNVSSLLGRISMEGNGAYGMTKHAMVAFSDTLRQEMKKWEVKVSIIEPMGYKTGGMYEHVFNLKRDEIWDSLNEETKKLYGKEYINTIYSTILSGFERLPDDLTPVIRAMRSGLLSKRPRERYSIGAGADVATYLFNLLPTWLTDKFIQGASLIPRELKPLALNDR